MKLGAFSDRLNVK